jgi:hypothetical protein
MTADERMNRFLIIASQDQRLGTTHVVVYLTLCALSSLTVDLSFAISRRQVMQFCKIRGIATYHKCVRELHAFGYIEYQPSYHPVNGSMVRLNDFEVLIKK